MTASFDYRDYELVPKPQSVYAKIFGARREYVLRKASKYGGHLRHRQDGDLDKATALHWLLHNRHGAAILDRVDLPAEQVADLLVRAAQMHSSTNKHEAPTMNSTERIEKNLRAMGEHEYTKIIGNCAKKLYPELTREQAFSKVFTAEDAEGQAIRRCWQIAKQGGDSDEVAAAEDDENALDELNALAADEKRRDPKLTKAQAFAKAYSDNPELAAKERLQNRPRA